MPRAEDRLQKMLPPASEVRSVRIQLEELKVFRGLALVVSVSLAVSVSIAICNIRHTTDLLLKLETISNLLIMTPDVQPTCCFRPL